MRQINHAVAEPKPLGVIDTLTAGFEVVRRRPWTLLIPVLLDVGIWLLPRLTLGPLLTPVIQAQFDTADVPADAAATVQQTRDALLQAANSLNLLGMVSSAANLTAHLPSLLAPSPLGAWFTGAGTVDVRSPFTALAFTLNLDSGALALLLFVPLFLLVLFAAAVYAESIAQGVRPLENQRAGAWFARAALLWLRLIALAALLGLVFVASSIVLSLVSLFAPAATDLGSFILALVLVGWFWLALYFFFAVSSMAVSGIGLLDGLRRSILVFRVYFWPSLLLIGLTVFLGEGMGLVWRGLTVTPPGVLLGIAANAFIGTSLFAASMVFYQDRMNAIDRLIAHARAASRTAKQ